MKNRIHPIYNLLLISAILFASCAKDKKNELVYFNDLENIKGWTGGKNNEETILKGLARSGQFSSKTDSLFQYGVGFTIKLSDLSEQPVKKVKASIWVNVPDIRSEAALIISVDSAGKNISWTSKSIKDFVKKTDEWTEVISEVQFPEMKTSKDYSLTTYIWNTGKFPVLADDSRIEFLK